MPYHDHDSGLDFASYDDYREAREPRPEPTPDDLCAARGHEYHGDDGGTGRCWCGAQTYPKGGNSEDVREARRVVDEMRQETAESINDPSANWDSARSVLRESRGE